MATFRTIVTDAMVELGVLQANESPSTDDAAWVMRKLIRLFDSWNAYRPAVFCELFTSFTFVPSQQDYTIGASGADITMALRPVTLEGFNVVLTNVSPVVRNPCNLRDYQWWQYQSLRTVTASFPTDVYYEPQFPLGILHVWPKPSVAYGGEIVTRRLIDEAITLNDTFAMPQGYQSAAVYTLSEECATGFSVSITEKLAQLGRETRARIFANNDFSGRLTTLDAGMPTSNGGRSSFNYRTGLNTPSVR